MLCTTLGRFWLERDVQAREVIRTVEAELVGVVKKATTVRIVEARRIAQVRVGGGVGRNVARVHEDFVGVDVEQVVHAHGEAHLLRQLGVQRHIGNPLGRERLVEARARWVGVLGLHFAKAYRASLQAKLTDGIGSRQVDFAARVAGFEAGALLAVEEGILQGRAIVDGSR